MATILVTGATNGLGLEMAGRLIEQKHEVFLHARTRARGEAVQHELGAPRLFIADLEDLDAVRRCAEEVCASGGVDVLVNNAGAFFKDLGHTPTGLERHFAVNHLGPFALTKILLPQVRERIVVVSSGAHQMANPDWDDLQWKKRSYSSIRAYAESKLFNILFTRELARRTQLSVNCLHPGFVNTGIGDRDASPLGRGLGKLMKVFGRSPEKAVACHLWAATSTEAGRLTGQYFVKSKVARTSALAKNDDLAQRLWGLSEELAGPA